MVFLILNSLNNPIASWPLIDFDFLLLDTEHLLFFHFLFLQLQNFYFVYFFYTSDNNITLLCIYSEQLFVLGIFDFFFYIIKFTQYIIYLSEFIMTNI